MKEIIVSIVFLVGIMLAAKKLYLMIRYRNDYNWYTKPEYYTKGIGWKYKNKKK